MKTLINIWEDKIIQVSLDYNFFINKLDTPKLVMQASSSNALRF